MVGRRRLHRTALGVVESRAFQLERATFRSEIQREGQALRAAPGAIHQTLHDAWRWAEHVVQDHYPHDCDEMCCGEVEEAAG
jgi:hypothetical protein